MRRESAQPHLDKRIAELASRQYGVVSRSQLVTLGASGPAIDRRLAIGRLHRVHRGVYSVGHRAVGVSALRLAAVLACGEGAVLSHRDGAAVWTIRQATGRLVDVTVPTRAGRRRRDGIRLHRSPLAPEEVTRVKALPVTTPSRTLVDLAEVLPARAVERALDEAEYLRLLDLREVRATLERNAARRGAHSLRRILDLHVAGATFTRSELEERFLALCRERGLVLPSVNARAEGYEVDFLWPSERLVVEVDGFAAHGTRRAFERDRVRDANLAFAGYLVLRFTYRQLSERPEWVAEQVARALASRPPSPAGSPACPPA